MNAEPMNKQEKCRILGVLDDGVNSLSQSALAHLGQAQLVIGGERTLALFVAHISPTARQRELTGALAQVPEWIRAAQAGGQRVVVLATGDPLCHGIAAYLASRLCIEAIEVIPNVSTLQLACARLGLPWQEMKFSSVHSKDAGEQQMLAATFYADCDSGFKGVRIDAHMEAILKDIIANAGKGKAK